MLTFSAKDLQQSFCPLCKTQTTFSQYFPDGLLTLAAKCDSGCDLHVGPVGVHLLLEPLKVDTEGFALPEKFGSELLIA